MRQISIIALAVAAVLLGACEKHASQPVSGSASPASGEPASAAATPARPASITDADVAVADELVGTLQELGKALGSAGTDCKAAIAAAEPFRAKLESIMERAHAIQQRTRSDAAAGTWFQAVYVPKFVTAMQPVLATAQACEHDKDFMTAFSSLPLPGRKVRTTAP